MNDTRLQTAYVIATAVLMMLACDPLDADGSESIIDKQIHGCELALKHYQAKVGDDAEPTPWPLTEEEKIYSTLCAGITKSVLTSLDAYGRTELEAEGVCLPDSTKDFDLTLLLPVVLEKMKSRLTQPSSNETYDAMFLVTTATLDALQDSYTCKRADVIE